jgi:MFS transporter, MHS family, proline/betaine transporter
MHQIPGSLSSREKRTIATMSIGVFLEYFDLYLYIHAISLLNKLFFSDYWNSLPFAFAAAFCSTHLLKACRGVLFSYIGDKIDRKPMIFVSTFIMVIACSVLAFLPTYEKIGITASIIATLCRMLQGASSMGEYAASEIYLTETIKNPFKVPVVALLELVGLTGSTCALMVSFSLGSNDFLWRGIFVIGAITALLGAKARISLKEDQDFVNSRNRIKHLKEIFKHHVMSHSTKICLAKTIASFFVIQCTWAVSFFFGLIYAGQIMKDKFGYSSQEIIKQNLIVVVLQLLICGGITVSSYFISPMRIFKIRTYLFTIILCACPMIFKHMTHPIELILTQVAILTLSSTSMPISPLIYSNFLVLTRLSTTLMTSSISKLLMNVVGAFGISYLVHYFAQWGLFMLMMPLTIGVLIAIRHFEQMEKRQGNQSITSFYKSKTKMIKYLS